MALAPTQTRTDQKHRTETSKYPYAEVEESVGGIRVVRENEPGKETYRIMHPSGSYTEMQPDGTVVSYTIGKSTHYTKGGVVMSIDENNDVRLAGHNTLRVGGGSHIEVAGDAGIAVKGNIALTGLGNMGLAVNGNLYIGASGSVNLNAPSFNVSSPNINIKGDIAMTGNFGQKGVHSDNTGGHVGSPGYQGPGAIIKTA